MVSDSAVLIPSNLGYGWVVLVFHGFHAGRRQSWK